MSSTTIFDNATCSLTIFAAFTCSNGKKGDSLDTRYYLVDSIYAYGARYNRHYHDGKIRQAKRGIPVAIADAAELMNVRSGETHVANQVVNCLPVKHDANKTQLHVIFAPARRRAICLTESQSLCLWRSTYPILSFTSAFLSVVNDSAT